MSTKFNYPGIYNIISRAGPKFFDPVGKTIKLCPFNYFNIFVATKV